MSIGFRRAAADEFGLPEPIIQIIQSFLTSKEAARTTLLSKSWRRAWLTRPNLDFDQNDFGRTRIFSEFAHTTLKRYENSKLKIENFRLKINVRYDDGPRCATKLIHRALKLGPTRLSFEFQDSSFHVPNEVFGYENLLSLTLKGCIINLDSDRDVCFSRLRFLCFENVRMGSRDMLFHIISSCPLIEKLSLCYVYVYVDVDGHGYGDGDGLQTLYLHELGDGDGDGMPTIYVRRLTSLVLKYVNFNTVFLADLSSKFPSLKDLTLCVDESREEILISSPTLERLDFSMGGQNGEHWGEVHSVRLDVPSIRKLTFERSSTIPKLSVKSHSRGWESYVEVYVTDWECISASWFYTLSNFIKKLRLSRISLSFHCHLHVGFDYEGGDIRGLPTPEIENLYICNPRLPSLSCYAMFDGLFRMCHPKVITQRRSNYGLGEKNIIRFLVKRFLDARDAKVSIPNQFMYGLNDLNEARAQVFDQVVSTWRDVALESLLEDSTIGEDYQDTRFQLNWKM